ncbi:L-Proline/Glycine betaine transporter ProP [Klebsiella pneumoniae]|uniref:L-Proline/Glycine betaine transporter ProP n=1 Tax=Klebsiella pneumoniae TaxID=573 RepID=A0A447RZ95_KLEPN|nr:L-Proline/Glycine betaine transporter ProP [Klebsiella pneumoniae]
MQQRKALAQELPVKAVALKHQKAVVISMLLTWLLSAGVGGGDPDVAGLAAEALWFCAGHYPAGQQHRHHYVVHRLSARRAGGGPLGASRTFIVGSLLLAVASWAFYHLAGASPQRLFLLYGTVGLCVGVVGRCPM